MRSRLLSCVSSWRCVVRICWCHSHHIRAHTLPIIVLPLVATHKCVGTKKDEQEEELIGMHEPVWWDGALPTVHTPAYVDGQMVWWLTYHRVRLGSYNRRFRGHSFLMNGLSQKCTILNHFTCTHKFDQLKSLNQKMSAFDQSFSLFMIALLSVSLRSYSFRCTPR